MFDENGEPLESLVDNAGTIEAHGGRVLLTANAAEGLVDNLINMDGVVQAHSVAEVNGEIVLMGGDGGAVSVAGVLDASGRDAGETGGAVKVLGERVGLFDGARVDVSGANGGGEALIGGNYQGKGAEPNAKATYVASAATIAADAVVEGDGGKVIVWADENTRFKGAISAKGGEASGDGGFAEVSGKRTLDFGGTVDLTAKKGGGGELLLDPNNITIQAAGADANIDTSGDPWATTGDNSILTVDTLVNQLALSNVTVMTSAAGTEAGDITVNDAIASGGANTLTLQAHNDITVNVNIDMSAGSGGLNFLADSDGNGTGGLTLALGAELRTKNRRIDIAANKVDLRGTIFTGTSLTRITGTNGAGFDLGSATDLAANTVELSDAELDRIDSDLIRLGDVASGAMTISADIDPANAGALRLVSGGAITDAGGTIRVAGLAVRAGGAVTLDNAGFDVNNLSVDAAGQTVTIADADAINIANVDSIVGITAETLNLAANGAITATAATTVAGTATLDAGAANDITLNLSTNDFGTVVIANANNAALRDANAIDLGASNVANGLSVTAGGALTDSGAVDVGGSFTINVGNLNDFTLNDAGLAFADMRVVRARHGTIVKGDGVVFSTSDLRGNLNVTAGGDITQTGNLYVDGRATLNAGTNDITLTNASNQFNQVAFAQANDVSLNSSTNVSLGTSDIGGDLTLTSWGNIGNWGGAAVAGTATFGARTNKTITLNSVANDFNRVNILNAKSASINDGNGWSIGTMGDVLALVADTRGTLTADTDFTVNGALTLKSWDRVVVAAGADIGNTAGNMVILANEVDIDGTIDIGNRSATIRPFSVGRNIDIGDGDGVDNASVLELTSADLDDITAGQLTIGYYASKGKNSVGNITITDDVNVANANTLLLKTWKSITDNGGGVTVNNLALLGISGVNLNDRRSNVNTVAMISNQRATYLDVDDLTVGNVAGVNGAYGKTGVNVGAGGDLVLDNRVLTQKTGSVTVSSGAGGTITANSVLRAGYKNSGSRLIYINTDDLELNAGASLGVYNGTSYFVRINAISNNIDLDLGAVGDTQANTFELSDAEMDIIGRDALSSNIWFGNSRRFRNVTVSQNVNVANGNAQFRINATGAVTQTGSLGLRKLALDTRSAITLDHAGNNFNTLAAYTNNGDITINNSDSLTVSGVSNLFGVDADNGRVSISTVNGGLTVANTSRTNDIEASNGVILTAGGNDRMLSINTNARVAASGGAIMLNADDMQLYGYVRNTGRVVSLGAANAGEAIVLGRGETAAADTLELNGSELDRITAATIRIGDADTGAVSVANDVSPSATNRVHVRTGSTFTATSGALNEVNLAITAGGDVTLTDANQNATRLAVNTTGEVTYRDANAIQLGTVDGVAGVTASSLTINAGGAVTDSAASNITNGLNVTAGAGSDITLDDNNNAFGWISVGGGRNVTLRRNANVNIAASTMTGALNVQSDNGVLISGVVQSGSAAIDADRTDAGVGGVVIAAGASLSTGAGGVSITADDVVMDGTLTAGAATVQVSDGDTFALGTATGGLRLDTAELGRMTVASLNARSTGAVRLGGRVATSGALDILAGTGVRFADGTEVDANGALNLAATAGGLTADGALTLRTTESLALAHDLAANGATTLVADSDGDGVGDLIVGAGLAISTGGNALSITANDVDLDGTLNSGTAATTIRASDGAAFAFGTATGGLVLDAAELTRVGAGVLNARTTGEVRFGGNVAATGALDIGAGTGVRFADATDLTVNGDLAMATATGAFTGDGALTVRTTESLTLAHDLTTNGATALITDSDGDGAGDLAIDAGRTLSTNGNAFAITANDIVLGGAIDSGAATVTVSDGATFAFGTAAGELVLDAAELGRLNATTLTARTTGQVRFGGTVATTGALDIDAGTGVRFDDGARLTVNGALGVTTAAGGIVGDGAMGIRTTESLALAYDLVANGDTTLVADSDGDGVGDLVVGAGLTIATGGGRLEITANDLDLKGTLDSGAAATAIEISDGGTIAMGADTGDMTISSAELSRITSGDLVVGGANTREVKVAKIKAKDIATIASAVRIQALADGGRISFKGGKSTFKAVSAKADKGVEVASDVAATEGDIAIDGDADDDTDGDDGIELAADLDAAGDVRLDATSGKIDLKKKGKIRAGRDVAINDRMEGNFDMDVRAGRAIAFKGAGRFKKLALEARAMTGTVHAKMLRIKGESADLMGTVDGFGGKIAANKAKFTGKLGRGPYLMNGFRIRGTYAEAKKGGKKDGKARFKGRGRLIAKSGRNGSFLGATPWTGGVDDTHDGDATPEDAVIQNLARERMVPDVFGKDFGLIRVSDEMRRLIGRSNALEDRFWMSIVPQAARPARPTAMRDAEGVMVSEIPQM